MRCNDRSKYIRRFAPYTKPYTKVISILRFSPPPVKTRRRRLLSAAFPPYAVRCVLTPSHPRDKIFQPDRTGRFSPRSGLRHGRPGARLGPVESADHLRRQRRRFPRKRAPYRAGNPEGMRLTASPPSPSLLPESFALMHRRASSDPPACVPAPLPGFSGHIFPDTCPKDARRSFRHRPYTRMRSAAAILRLCAPLRHVVRLSVAILNKI